MKLKNIIYPLLAGAAFAACTPNDYELGTKDVKSSDLVEGSAYTVEVDQKTNTVTMTSLMPSGYTVLWDYDGGRSQDPVKKVQYPFEGKKFVVFGVETRGGAVYGDTCWIDIQKTNPGLLTGDLWTFISGGVGQKKRWVCDIDVAGGSYASVYFTGPLSFFGTDDGWNTCTLGQSAPEGADSWNWNADYAGNASWIFGDPSCPPNGYMEFDLQDGANITVYDANTNTTVKGSYMIDIDNHTMSLNNAQLLHDPGRDAIVTKWGQIAIFSMTEHTMQLGVIRDNDPNEGKCYLVYNFVEEGWKPEQKVAGTTFTDVAQENANADLTTTTSLTWKLNADAPYDWFWFDAASGSWTSNGFNSANSYSATTWAPVVDEDEIAEFSLYMTRASVNATGGQYLLTNNKGETVDGNYTSDGAWIKFDKEVTLLSVTQAATSTEVDNSWTLEIKGTEFRVVQNTDDDLWLGMPTKKDVKGNTTEYACVKIQKKTGGSEVKVSRSVNVDNSKVRYGDLEGNGNFRIQFYNVYGGDLSQGDNAPVNPLDIYYKKQCVISFTVSGLGTFDPVTAFIMNSAQDAWSASEGVNTFQFSGDGTYDAVITGKAVASESLVFLIDCLGVQSLVPGIELNGALGDDNRLDGVTVTINSIKMD